MKPLLRVILVLLTISASAQHTKLLDFTGTANGDEPWGSLISDGTFLYGMTSKGGSNDQGTIFKIKPDGTAYTKLLDFSSASTGGFPFGSLVSDGTFLYGMTEGGGTNNLGVIFKIKPDGTGFVKLLDFAGTANGSEPYGSLLFDGTSLYGMTTTGGTNNVGTIFKIMPDGTGYTKLLDMAAAANGSYPNGSLISDGTFLYGMASEGGTGNNGTLFKINKNGTGFIKLLNFTGAANGSNPYGSLLYDGAFLYGMTYSGGSSNDGTIFKIKTDGTGYVRMFNFNLSIGDRPFGDLVSDGTFLYGMTYSGGSGGTGNLFKIKPDGTGFQSLHDFASAVNGWLPYGSLLLEGSSLYGMTQQGGIGDAPPFNGGTIFKYALSVSVPTITSFTPSSGPVGTAVTITGTNFSATPSGNIVFFGATKASVTSATTTQLSVTVPVGATYKPITVLVNGLQAYSSKPFVVTFAGGSTITASSFAPKVDFTTGTSPRSVSIGDLDGDGKADMAIASVFNNAISIYRNTSQAGSITFAAKVDFTTGASSNPYCVAIGDLDGDGKQEMAVVNYNANTLSVLRNTSSGAGTISFATKVDFATGAFPRYVSIGDLDADGKPDLVVSNAGSNTISIFRNTSVSTGTISYAAKTDLTGTTGGMAVLINDLDDDGRSDLAVANWSNPGALTIYRNMTTVPGSISFAAKVDFLTGHNFLWSVAAGDLDNDGRSDLASPISSVAAVMRNNSTSGSISFDPVLDLAATAYASFVSINDLNGDGKVDLAVSNDSNGSVSAFENTSTGVGVVSFGSNVDFMTGALPVSNAIADIDGDGRADLVVPNHDANTVSILRNTMGTSSSPPTITSFTPASGLVGTSVIITGTNFSTTTTSNEVKVNGTTAIVSASTTTSITVTVPANATTGKITVTVAGHTATSVTDFTVTTMTSGNQPPDIQSATIEAPVNGIVTLDLAALLSDPDDNLDLSTLKIIVPPLSGAIATIDGQSNLILDYTGISFSGTEELTIEVCDLSGSCAQKELDIEVAGDFIVYNAVSPNGDGKNDFLYLQHIDLLEETKENHVTILNRWGSVVWEGHNYDNTSVVFNGQSKNGNDLPSGSYFYRIEFSGDKKHSGFLSLKR